MGGRDKSERLHLAGSGAGSGHQCRGHGRRYFVDDEVVVTVLGEVEDGLANVVVSFQSEFFLACGLGEVHKLRNGSLYKLSMRNCRRRRTIPPTDKDFWAAVIFDVDEPSFTSINTATYVYNASISWLWSFKVGVVAHTWSMSSVADNVG